LEVGGFAEGPTLPQNLSSPTSGFDLAIISEWLVILKLGFPHPVVTQTTAPRKIPPRALKVGVLSLRGDEAVLRLTYSAHPKAVVELG